MTSDVLHIAFSAADRPAALKLWRELDRLGCDATLGVITLNDGGVAQAPQIAANVSHILLLASQDSVRDLFVSQTLDEFLKTRSVEKIFPVLVQAPENEGDEETLLNPIYRYTRDPDDGFLRPRANVAPFLGVMDQESAQTIARRIVTRLRTSSGPSNYLDPIAASVIQTPMPWGAAGIAAAAAIFFGVWGYGQYQLAESEALQAHLARQASRQMLANLDDTLSSPARREVFLRLSDDVFALTEQDVGNVDPADLARQAGLLHVIGEVHTGDGDLPSAMIAYRRAADITEQLLNDAPESPEAIYGHAQSVFWIGDSALIAGDFDEAAVYFETYALLANQLVGIDANNPIYRAEWAYAQSNLGAVSIGRNEREEALRFFDSAIEGYQAGPIEAGIVSRRSLSNAYGWRAGPLRGLGRIEEAIASRSNEIEILEELFRENPESRHLREALVNALQSRIDMRLDLGQIELAQIDAEQASPMIGALFEEMPESRLIRRKYLENELLGVRIALFQGDTIRAQLIHNAASRAYTSGPGVASEDGRRIDLGHLDLLRAKIALASGAYEAGLSAAIEAATDYEADILHDGSRLRHFAAFARFYAGEALFALGRQGDAEREWRRGLLEIEQIDPPRDLRADDVFARLRFRLGDREEGRRGQQALIDSGYARPDFIAFWSGVDDQLSVQNTNLQEDEDG
jgi:tetratricopeptide (TPR) repeat protein